MIVIVFGKIVVNIDIFQVDINYIKYDNFKYLFIVLLY